MSVLSFLPFREKTLWNNFVYFELSLISKGNFNPIHTDIWCFHAITKLGTWDFNYKGFMTSGEKEQLHNNMEPIGGSFTNVLMQSVWHCVTQI